jgi:hypothetical protein
MMTSTLLFAYFGPETVLPVTSIVATIAGLAMMFGRHALRLVVNCGRLILTGKTGSKIPADRAYRGPHATHSGQPDRVAVGDAEPYDRSAA